METEYKKSSAILVLNNKREVALQLRAAHDSIFPAHWDFSAGGGIDEGEEEAASAKRELQEELGVEAEVEFVSKEHYMYPSWKPSVMRETDLWIYKAVHGGPFTPEPEEVDEAKFFTLEKIEEMIESGEKFHPEFTLSWEKGIISRIVKD
jgi:isopentenyl-diphosphate Delta-isomerase